MAKKNIKSKWLGMKVSDKEFNLYLASNNIHKRIDKAMIKYLGDKIDKACLKILDNFC